MFSPSKGYFPVVMLYLTREADTSIMDSAIDQPLFVTLGLLFVFRLSFRLELGLLFLLTLLSNQII